MSQAECNLASSICNERRWLKLEAPEISAMSFSVNETESLDKSQKDVAEVKEEYIINFQPVMYKNQRKSMNCQKKTNIFKETTKGGWI